MSATAWQQPGWGAPMPPQPMPQQLPQACCS